jgi:hypothetical protein
MLVNTERPPNTFSLAVRKSAGKRLRSVKARGRLTQVQNAAIRAVLFRELAQATRLVASASMELNAIMRNFPDGIPREATQTFQNASTALSTAREEMATAQQRLDAYITQGTVPEDVRPLLDE